MVQWKLPGSVSTFVQCTGRVTQALGQMELAVLLIEQLAYGVDLDLNVVEAELMTNIPKKRSKGKPKKKVPGAMETSKLSAQVQKKAAEVRGSKRGCGDGKHNIIFVKEQPRLDVLQADEGLLMLVQTGKCHWLVLTIIYGNKTAHKLNGFGRHHNTANSPQITT